MNFKVYSAATTEGVTVTEVKTHIRLDSTNMSSNLTTVQVIAGGYHDITSAVTCTGTDVLGYDAMMQLDSFLNSGGSTVTAKIQESDDNTTYTDWTGGGFTSITTANDTAIQQIEYTGTKQYIRPYVTVSAAQSNFAVNVIKSTPYSSEDSYIGSLITRARLYAESYQRRSLAPTVYELTLNQFPTEDCIRLPLASPMLSVTAVASVKYEDSTGTTATFTASTSGYYVDIDTEPANVVLSYAMQWPVFTERPTNAIRIRYTAGYETLPEDTKHAIIMLAGAYYTYRDAEVPTGLMNTIQNILDNDRIGGWCD